MSPEPKPKPGLDREKRLRLLKIVVQPVFVIDDGEKLEETDSVAPLSIPGSEWPAWATDGYPKAVESVVKQYEERGTVLST